MIRSLLAFELKYHSRQISFGLAAVLFLGLGFLLSNGNFGGDVHKNSPYVIAYLVSFLSMFSIFVATLLCANVVLRDDTYKMDGLIFTTAIRWLPYFMIRYTGLLLAVFFIVCLLPVGLYIDSLLSAPDKLGPFSWKYFLHPLFIFGLPNVLFCTSVVFATALLTRSARAVYAAGVSLFLLYFVGSILGNSPLMANSTLNPDGPGLLSVLLDPFGISSFFGETRGWTIIKRNTQLFPVGNRFLLNRLVWTGISLLLLGLSLRYFKFHLPQPARIKKQKAVPANKPLIVFKPVIPHPGGFTYYFSAFRSQLRLETVSVFKHIPFLVMLLLWIFVNAIELKENLLHGPYGIRFYSASGYIAEELLSVRPALLLLVFYAAEMISRERATNIQGLVFSTPVSNSILWSAKSATLGILVTILITANIITGIGMQLFTGNMAIEPLIYLSLFYYSGLPLFLFALLIIFIQTLISNKYLGMLISLFVMGLIVFGGTLGIHNYLVRFATTPPLNYSAMNGFGHYTTAFNWYMLYWLALAIALSVLAAGIWQGSSYTSWWQRFRSAGQQWGLAGKIILSFSIFAWIGTGYYIHKQTGTISTARTGQINPDWQVQYEQKYKGAASLQQPVIIAVRAVTDIYPNKGTYIVNGTYRIKNNNSIPLKTLWIGTDPEVTTARFTIAHAAEAVTDKVFNQYWYELDKPLQPGDEMDVQFSMEVNRSPFMPFNSENSVASNGSYIELEKYIPFFGYNERFETDDPRVRKKNKLPPLIPVTSPDSSYHLVDIDHTVSTDASQQVITTGRLQKAWTKDGRNYFHYKTEQPVALMMAISSARYAIEKENYKGIEFSIYYQPGQAYNVPAMLMAMKDAIGYGNSHFSPYPFTYITLAEIPEYPGSATAYPGVVFCKEKYNFMSDFSDSNRFNTTYATVAHEVAHQWWANRLAPRDAPGRAFLTESLAKYTEAIVTEKRFGKMYLRSYLQKDNALYFAMRAMPGQPELPLLQTSGQPFVYYQKGGLALYALKELMGEEYMNAALRQLLAKHSSPGSKAMASDLYDELSQHANSSQAKQLEDQLKKVIVYDNKLKVLHCESLPDGRFCLQLHVMISKTDQTHGAIKTMVPDDEITIGVFDTEQDNWTRFTQPVYLQKYHFAKNDTMLTIIVDKKPLAVAIDPYNYLLDENLANNIQKVNPVE